MFDIQVFDEILPGLGNRLRVTAAPLVLALIIRFIGELYVASTQLFCKH